MLNKKATNLDENVFSLTALLHGLQLKIASRIIFIYGRG
jgi:hypothetical protein